MSHSVHPPPRHCNALIGIAIGLAHLPLHHELLRKSARYQEASQQPEENLRKMRRLVDGEKNWKLSRKLLQKCRLMFLGSWLMSSCWVLVGF